MTGISDSSSLGLIVTTLFLICTLKLAESVYVSASTVITPLPPLGIAFTAALKFSNTSLSSKTKLGSIIVKVLSGYSYLLSGSFIR